MADSNPPKPAVVIPAHNEGPVIDRCLQALAEGVEPGWADIIVVANGCTDDTAERARNHPGVTVIDTPQGGKIAALNLGDEAATGFPRAYVDADVTVSGADLESVFSVLARDDVHAAAPALDVDTSRSTRPVRAFYDIWTRLPYVTDNMVGCGVFCLSADGHERVAPFPEGRIADDEHVRLSFPSGERLSVEGASFTIVPPRDLRSLVSVEARRREGNTQIRSSGELETETVDDDQRRAVGDLARRPKNWPKLALFVGVKVAVEVTRRWRVARGSANDWSQDRSSR